MENCKITVGNASKIFADFEQENVHYLSGLLVHQYSLWQIVKWPLLGICLKKANQQNSTATFSDSKRKPFFARLVKNSKIVFKELYFLFLLQNKKYGDYLFVTYSADKLAVNENDLYYNSLMDPLIDYFEQNKIPFLHYEYDIKANQPAYRTGLYDLSKIDLVRRFFKEAPVECNEFVNIFNTYFKNKAIDVQITSGNVNEAVDQFFFQKGIWKKMFKKNRPDKIFTSEITNTGFLAACNELGISAYEFQHGTIDKDHPKYSIEKSIVDNSIPLKPAAYIVFGPSTTQTLRQHSFNDSIDIIELGKKSVEDARKNVSVNESKNVLLCLQPFMNRFNLDLINSINLQQDSINFNFTLKLHPLQKDEEQNKLKAAIEGNKRIKLAPTNQKIHNLINFHDMVAAHTSHVLEECISLNKPAVTIGTEDTPNGILDILDMAFLNAAIKPAAVTDLISVINRFYNDSGFKEEWIAEVDKYKNFFYKNNYYQNIKEIL
jgi:hypothetical protein